MKKIMFAKIILYYFARRSNVCLVVLEELVCLHNQLVERETSFGKLYDEIA
jgi:hypothetical protein